MNLIERIRRIGYVVAGTTLAGTIIASASSKDNLSYQNSNLGIAEQTEVQMLPTGRQNDLERTVDYVPELNNKIEKKIDYITKDFSGDSDEVILARMIFGEARSCSDEERIAVGYTALTRAHDGKKWNGENIKESILMPQQYSCFNSNDPNRKVVMNPLKYDKIEFLECLDIAKGIISGKYNDPTNGATNYFNPNDVKTPSWAKNKRVSKIGRINTEKGLSRHVFYKEN